MTSSLKQITPEAQTLRDRIVVAADRRKALAMVLNLAYAIADNSSAALAHLLETNRDFRLQPSPTPYDSTCHRSHLGDARKLAWISSESVHLVVTSPPYFTLKTYARRDGQMAEIDDYEHFLDELDKVWRECARVLVPGGRICCVVGDVCVSRRRGGRHYVLPLHADIQVRARKNKLDSLTPILWSKIANGAKEAEGNGAGFSGKPYQPGAVVKNDIEYSLFMRKGPYIVCTASQANTTGAARGWRRTSGVPRALA